MFKGFESYGSLSLRGLVTPQFPVALAVRLYVGPHINVGRTEPITFEYHYSLAIAHKQAFLSAAPKYLRQHLPRIKHETIYYTSSCGGVVDVKQVIKAIWQMAASRCPFPAGNLNSLGTRDSAFVKSAYLRCISFCTTQTHHATRDIDSKRPQLALRAGDAA